jgi:poly(A) polymerase
LRAPKHRILHEHLDPIMAAENQWGVTPPISTLLPTEAEKRSNDSLFAELKAQNTYEHATETQKR